MERSGTVKKLVRWFHTRKWRTCSRAGDTGIYLESPVHNCAGLMERQGTRWFCWERKLSAELYSGGSGFVNIRIFQRKHYWKPDPSVPSNGFWYTHIPSDEFSEWTEFNKAPYVDVPVGDIIQLGKLLEAMRSDYGEKPQKIHDHCGGVIGRDTSYEKIEWGYSNERLRKERETENAYEWKP